MFMEDVNRKDKSYEEGFRKELSFGRQMRFDEHMKRI